MDLAYWLLTSRYSRKLSQQDVADFVGVDRSTISTWESGHTQPRARYYLKLAEILGLDCLALLQEKEASLPEMGCREQDPLLTMRPEFFQQLIDSLKESLRAKDELIACLQRENARLRTVAEPLSLEAYLSLTDR